MDTQRDLPMPAAARPSRLLTIARPILWLAGSAFITGFAAYLALGHHQVAVPQDRQQAIPISSGPASGEWNLPKKI